MIDIALSKTWPSLCHYLIATNECQDRNVEVNNSARRLKMSLFAWRVHEDNERLGCFMTYCQTGKMKQGGWMYLMLPILGSGSFNVKPVIVAAGKDPKLMRLFK